MSNEEEEKKLSVKDIILEKFKDALKNDTEYMKKESNND